MPTAGIPDISLRIAPSRLLKKDAAPPPTLRWWGGDCQATPYVRQFGPPPTPRRWRRDWRLSAVEFKPLLAWKSFLHRHGVGGGRTLNHAISRSVITPPTQGWWRCSVVFQQPAKSRTTNFFITIACEAPPLALELPPVFREIEPRYSERQRRATDRRV